MVLETYTAMLQFYNKILITLFFLLLAILTSVVIVRPVELVIIERLGKPVRTLTSGFHLKIPLLESKHSVNVTERMVDVEPQTVITKDKLNVKVDAIVYYKIIDPMAALYNVQNHEAQLVSLTKTTLRAVIGRMSLTETNENRDEINSKVEEILDKETASYGVDVLRAEIQRIEPPENVQSAMNDVVRTENLKLSAQNEADAAETKADGLRRAAIKEADGKKKAIELDAEGKATAIRQLANAEADKIKAVNDAINQSFTGQAVEFKKLETAVTALEQNTKIIVGDNKNLVNVIGDATGVIPIKKV